MSEFLSDEDLVQLTGAIRSTKQIEVLKKNGIRYFRRFDGKPVVAKEAIYFAIHGNSYEDFGSDDGFNLEAIQH